MEECRRVRLLFRGCNFEARFDNIGPDPTIQFQGRGNMTDVIKAMDRKIYVRDVCTTCGKTIERVK